jgi:Domain of unknown function (DUF4340)
MNRKTLLAGAVFAGLLVIALVVLRSPEKGDRVAGEAPRPLPKIAEGSVDTLEVTKDGKTTVLKKEGTTYKVTAPVAYAADNEAAKAAFEAIEKLDFAGIVSDQKAKHTEFELDAKSPRVVAKKGGTVLADLRVGKVANNQTMVRLEGKDEVWQAVGSLKYQLDKDAAGWRDKSIVTYTEADAERLEVVAKNGGKIVLTRPPKGDAGAAQDWKVVESSVKVEPFDKAVPGDLVTALANLKANDFADGAPASETGLDAPELTVTVGLKGDKKETLLIGKKKGDEDFYVKTGKGDQVFLVKKYALDRVNKRPIEFRDKTICNLSDSDITQVAVTRDKESYTLVKDPKKSGDDAWKLAKPAGVTLDGSKVSGILSGFKEWKATSFAEDNAPKATGLDKPSATIAATSKGRTCSVKVGSELSDKQNSYVAVAGASDVMVAPKWTLDRVLVKVDDLKKK